MATVTRVGSGLPVLRIAAAGFLEWRQILQLLATA
jgi:hypothetical protein